ncbi:MAG: type II toxin-antitoxin system death-on-curing family toxin [Acidobacteria bacterium]|nr:type II toxin-antitoxin system death-on-curing family toxin [Acidobacteriota bacterium]
MNDYLTMAEILAMHEDQIHRYGGSTGVRDHGLLESALYRPQTGYYADLIEEAAALWESLAQNHPFIDGNKRTAFAATYTFLAINGAQLTADAEQTFAFISGLYERGEFNFDQLLPWLRSNVARR